MQKNSIFRTIFISSIGGMLEFYDFVVFILFAKILSQVFFPLHSSYFALIEILMFFAVGYFVRPIGGIILSHFGDKYGRKRIFMLTVFLMAFSTLLIGFIPSYRTIGVFAPFLLLIFRLIQGLAVGGEIPGAGVFIYEHMPEKYVCFGVSSLIAGLTLGMILGSFVGMVSSGYFAKDFLYSWGWRIPFVFGGILGFVGVYIRCKLLETPIFLELQNSEKIVKLPLVDVSKKYKMGVFKGFCVTLTDAVLVTTFSLYLPIYLIENAGYTFHGAMRLNFIGCIIVLISILVFGQLSIKFKTNVKKVYFIAVFSQIFISFLFFLAVTTSSQFYLIVTFVLANICNAISYSVFFILLLREFPAGVRFSGVAFSYSIAFAIFGGVTPLLITLMIHITGSKLSPAYLVIFACIVGICTLFKKRAQKECNDYRKKLG